MRLEEVARDRSLEPFTPNEIDYLHKGVLDVLTRVKRGEQVRAGDVTPALGALRRIVEQAKRAK